MKFFRRLTVMINSQRSWESRMNKALWIYKNLRGGHFTNYAPCLTGHMTLNGYSETHTVQNDMTDKHHKEKMIS